MAARSKGLLGGVTRSVVGDHCTTLDNIDGLLDHFFAWPYGTISTSTFMSTTTRPPPRFPM
jgi:hypothetical protein